MDTSLNGGASVPDAPLSGISLICDEEQFERLSAVTKQRKDGACASREAGLIAPPAAG